MTQYHYCRVCNRGHGLHIDRTDPQNIVVHPIPKEPLSLGNICAASTHAQHARTHEDRFQMPQKKEDGVWKQVPWEQALSEIGETFQKIAKRRALQRLGWGWVQNP